MLKSVILDPFSDPKGTPNRPFGRHFQPKRLKKVTAPNESFHLGAVLDPPGSDSASKMVPGQIFLDFGPIWDGFWTDLLMDFGLISDGFSRFFMDIFWMDLGPILDGFWADFSWIFTIS